MFMFCMKFSGGETPEMDLPLWSRCGGIDRFYHCSRDSSILPPAALLYWLPHPHVITFLLYSQPCGPEHTPLHLIREYYLTLGGQHSSTSGFCQQCISFCGCPKSISVVPAAPQGTLSDLCHFSSTRTVSLSRFFSLRFLLIWIIYCTSQNPSVSWYQFYLANIRSLCSHLLCECSFGSYIEYTS